MGNAPQTSKKGDQNEHGKFTRLLQLLHFNVPGARPVYYYQGIHYQINTDSFYSDFNYKNADLGQLKSNSK